MGDTAGADLPGEGRKIRSWGGQMEGEGGEGVSVPGCSTPLNAPFPVCPCPRSAARTS